MADVAPFRGLRYNSDKVTDPARVVIPPYDVISSGEQESYYKVSPYNMIRLELGKRGPDDGDNDNPHTRAASFIREWQREGILVRDERPAMYYYELDYPLGPDSWKTRHGFLCVIRLEDFSTGGVRPHEKTFQAVKDERLGLIQACQANLSPVFALYSDPAMIVDHTLRAGRERDPILRFTDFRGMAHRIWRVENREVLLQVNNLMQKEAIFIADGHHRYETALNYRSIQRARYPQAGRDASFEYILMYLSNLNQGGLTILPTHRLIRSWGTCNPSSFLSLSREFFDTTTYDAGEAGKSMWREELEAAVSRKETAIGFFFRGAGSYYLFRARNEAVSSYLGRMAVPEALISLDVVVLDRVILQHLLALPEMFLSNEKNIRFNHDFSEALASVESGEYEAAFFINSTRIEQVQDVANAGLIMPHKSTYFYPKVSSGLVINPLSPDEGILW